jgi:hypothetical protein
LRKKIPKPFSKPSGKIVFHLDAVGCLIGFVDAVMEGGEDAEWASLNVCVGMELLLDIIVIPGLVLGAVIEGVAVSRVPW